MSVSSTNNFHGDTFNAAFVTGSGGGGQAWWASQDSLKVDVQVGIVPPGGGEPDTVWTTMLTGIVDRISADPINGSVSVDGRDLTAYLTDSTAGGYDVNQTSSEVVTKIAGMVGLTPVAHPTTNLIGRFFQLEHTQGSLQRGHRVANMWDAVVELARLEGFDAWVSGSSLYFQPQADLNSTPYVVNAALTNSIMTSNAMTLRCARALHIAQGIKVTVRSWNVRQAKAITATAQSGGGLHQRQQQYNVLRAGLTQDQADSLAKRLLAELSRHERTIDGEMPGDLILTPRVMLAVQGTNTAWDQPYYPQTVQHTVGGQGFRTSFTAKNQSPEIQTGAS